MGWDEVVEANLVGPLAVSIGQSLAPRLVNRTLPFWGHINGRASHCNWSFGDGIVLTNASPNTAHAWTNAGDYTVTFTAFNNDFPDGVSTNLLVQIAPLAQPRLQSPAISNNAFRFSFDTQESGKYTIQYATNLVPPVTWQNHQVIFYSPGGPTQISDPAWTNAARFYRVLVQ